MKRGPAIAAVLGVVLLVAVAVAAEWIWDCPLCGVSPTAGPRTTRAPHVASFRIQPTTRTTTLVPLTGIARRAVHLVTLTRPCATAIVHIGGTHRSGKATSSPRTRGRARARPLARLLW